MTLQTELNPQAGQLLTASEFMRLMNEPAPNAKLIALAQAASPNLENDLEQQTAAKNQQVVA